MIPCLSDHILSSHYFGTGTKYTGNLPFFEHCFLFVFSSLLLYGCCYVIYCRMPRRHRSRSRFGTRASGRGRSRDREDRRRRHRDHRDSLSRSASRGLYDLPEEPVQAIKKLVTSQQEIILDLLSEHRAEVEEKIQLKSRRFSSKQIEKQYQINAEFRDLAAKITAALHASEVSRAQEVLSLLSTKLEDHEHDLIVADTSPHGWLAVAKLRSNTELPKTLRKKLAQVEKDLAHRRPPQQQQQQYGGPRKKFDQFQREGQSFSRRRPDQRLSPEEALSNAAKQLRQGTCTHCHKGLHYYRECPDFWTKVQESRAAKAKTGGDGD